MEDGSTEGRRCQLWGGLWAEYQIPDLPDAEEFTELLAACDVPAEIVSEVGTVAGEYGRLRAAAQRSAEISAVDDADVTAQMLAEQDGVLDVLDTGPDILARYAETLTRSLPALRRVGWRGDATA